MNIKTLSRRLAGQVASSNQRDKAVRGDSVKVVAYGLELIIDTLIKFILILGCAVAVGLGQEVLLALAGFWSMRSQAGGYHMRTGAGCTFMMIALCGISSVLSKFLRWNSVFLVLSVFFVLVLLYWSAPCDTKNNPISKISVRKKMKRNSLIVMSFWGIIALMSSADSVKGLIMIPCIWESLSILPYGKLFCRKAKSVSGNI